MSPLPPAEGFTNTVVPTEPSIHLAAPPPMAPTLPPTPWCPHCPPCPAAPTLLPTPPGPHTPPPPPGAHTAAPTPWLPHSFPRPVAPSQLEAILHKVLSWPLVPLTSLCLSWGLRPWTTFFTPWAQLLGVLMRPHGLKSHVCRRPPVTPTPGPELGPSPSNSPGGPADISMYMCTNRPTPFPARPPRAPPRQLGAALSLQKKPWGRSSRSVSPLILEGGMALRPDPDPDSGRLPPAPPRPRCPQLPHTLRTPELPDVAACVPAEVQSPPVSHGPTAPCSQRAGQTPASLPMPHCHLLRHPDGRCTQPPGQRTLPRGGAVGQVPPRTGKGRHAPPRPRPAPTALSTSALPDATKLLAGNGSQSAPAPAQPCPRLRGASSENTEIV